MNFSKPKNLIILIISLLIVVSLSINATVAWFRHTSKSEVTTNVTVLDFDFKTNNVYKQAVTLTFSTSSSSTYTHTIMAPGVRGYHQFSFTNKGNVPVAYTVTIDKANSTYPSNMDFYSTNTFASSAKLSGNTVWQDVVIQKNGTSTPAVGFLWRFEDNSTVNAADAAFNQQYDNIVLKFIITAYQYI